jgi:hypothetical protein
MKSKLLKAHGHNALASKYLALAHAKGLDFFMK